MIPLHEADKRRRSEAKGTVLVQKVSGTLPYLPMFCSGAAAATGAGHLLH
jgi:hypothetical protein